MTMNKTRVTRDNIGQLAHRDKVRFALFCVKQGEHLIKRSEVHKCIELVELWLKGEVSVEECEVAARVVNNLEIAPSNIITAAYYAANSVSVGGSVLTSTTYAYYTAVNTTYVSNITKGEQEAYLYELIHINEIVEQVILGGNSETTLLRDVLNQLI